VHAATAFPHSPRGYVLWTGSHRIAAAHAAGLAVVPCRIIPYELVHATFKRLQSVVGFADLRTALTSSENGGGPRDEHRLAALEKLALSDAADALREEIETEGGSSPPTTTAKPLQFRSGQDSRVRRCGRQKSLFR
jgi:hypothetical protein